MRLLAIDTAREACTAAAVGEDGRRFIRSETIGRGHAERLFGMMEAVVAEAGLSFPELQRIAVTVGPGSFTGLRIGIAAARGLALVGGTPVLGLSTLAVHAAHARDKAGGRPILALIEAKGGEAFGELFSPQLDPVGEAAVAPLGVWAERARRANACLCGSGAPQVAEAMGASAAPVVHRLSAPDPDALLDLALLRQPDGRPVKPLYLKPPDAVPRAAP